MNELQWSIVETAFHDKTYTHNLARDAIKELYQGGPDQEVPEDQVRWLNDVGKRYGLVPWESLEEQRKFASMHRSLKNSMPSWKKRWLAKKAGSGRRGRR